MVNVAVMIFPGFSVNLFLGGRCLQFLHYTSPSSRVCSLPLSQTSYRPLLWSKQYRAGSSAKVGFLSGATFSAKNTASSSASIQPDPGVPDNLKNCSVRFDALLTLAKSNTKVNFYTLQVLEQDKTSEIFLWRRWGVVGRPGRGLLTGPLGGNVAERLFARTFRRKTALAYNAAASGAPAIPGRYVWALSGTPIPSGVAAAAAAPAGTRKRGGRSAPAPRPAVEWEFLSDPGDGARPERWLPFAPDGSALAERLRDAAAQGGGAPAAGAVRSGRFRYELDLSDPANCTQRNLDVPPHRVRRIRRVVH